MKSEMVSKWLDTLKADIGNAEAVLNGIRNAGEEDESLCNAIIEMKTSYVSLTHLYETLKEGGY
jgi:hypothetical protein